MQKNHLKIFKNFFLTISIPQLQTISVLNNFLTLISQFLRYWFIYFHRSTYLLNNYWIIFPSFIIFHQSTASLWWWWHKMIISLISKKLLNKNVVSAWILLKFSLLLLLMKSMGISSYWIKVKNFSVIFCFVFQKVQFCCNNQYWHD